VSAQLWLEHPHQGVAQHLVGGIIKRVSDLGVYIGTDDLVGYTLAFSPEVAQHYASPSSSQWR
jgi:hypothetical protein